MNIKTPFGGEVEFNPDLCSKVLPDEDGVLKTGYVAVCPKSEKQFEVSVTITGCGTDAEKAVIESKELAALAVTAAERNALADAEMKKAGPKAMEEAVALVEKLDEVAKTGGVELSNQMKTKLAKTATAAKVSEAIAPTMAKFDEGVAVEEKKKAAATKELAEAAIARAGS